MDIAVITGPSYETARSRILLANDLKDGIELRLDLFGELDFEKIFDLRKLVRGKVIFTLRSRKQGGGFSGSEEKRLKWIEALLQMEPDYFDIEYDTQINSLEKALNTHFPVKVISSYHNFSRTPKNLEHVLQKMISDRCYAYKICTTANSLSDSYLMLRFIHKFFLEGMRIIGICMGEYGKITRRDGIKTGNYLNYSIVHARDAVAPGLDFA